MTSGEGLLAVPHPPWEAPHGKEVPGANSKKHTSHFLLVVTKHQQTHLTEDKRFNWNQLYKLESIIAGKA